MQVGTLLEVGVGQPTTNTAQVTEEGNGADTVESNGGATNSFTGLKAIVFDVQRAKSDQITFHSDSPGTTGTALAVGSVISSDAALAKEGSHPDQFRRASTGVVAVQSSSGSANAKRRDRLHRDCGW